MSRSYKHNPYTGWTCSESEKSDKRKANRRWRRKDKSNINECLDWDDLLIPEENDFSDIATFSKDGKQRINPNSRYLRK